MGRLAKHLERAIQETFSEFGLNVGEFDVLATLRSGHPYQLSPTALFNALMVTSGTMTHRIDQLEQAELVKRIPSERSPRHFSLTDKGFDLIEKRLQLMLPMNRILSVLKRSERESLTLLLRKLLLSFEDRFAKIKEFPIDRSED